MDKKILVMLIVAALGLPIQVLLTSWYPASDLSFITGLSLAVFGIAIAIQISLYSRKKIKSF